MALIESDKHTFVFHKNELNYLRYARNKNTKNTYTIIFSYNKSCITMAYCLQPHIRKLETLQIRDWIGEGEVIT